MAGIDNTLIAYIAQSLLNCKVSHLTGKLLWLTTKLGEHFAYGRDFFIKWPMTDMWMQGVANEGTEEIIEAMAALQARAGTQPMPDSRFKGMFTFESHLYEVMMHAAEQTGLEERQVIQRILHGCAEYHLSDALMAKLRSFTTLDALFRHMITTARDAAAPNAVRVHTQRYLRQFAEAEQMPDGFFQQEVYLENETIILSISEGLNGKLRQYMLSADWQQLMANNRCICLQGLGGMGKSTFLRALHAVAIQERDREKPAISAAFYLSLATVTDDMLRAFREKANLFDNSILWYCVCWGDESYYRSDVAPRAGAKSERPPTLLLLDGMQELEGSAELKRCIQEDLERLSRQSWLFVMVASRLPLPGSRLQQTFHTAYLTGTPVKLCCKLMEEYALPEKLKPLLDRPLYYNLFRRLLNAGGGTKLEQLATSYALFSRVLEEDVRRWLAPVHDEAERTHRVYLLHYILPQLARRMMGLGRRSLHYEDMIALLEEISADAAGEPQLTRRLCELLADEAPLVEPNRFSPAVDLLAGLLNFGWIILRDGLCDFCHQEHQAFLAARLLACELRLTGQSCTMLHPDTLPRINLNQPAPVIDMLKEALLHEGVAQGLASCAKLLPHVTYADELTPQIVACADAVRQIGEYMRLSVKEHAPLLLSYLRRVTDCLEDVGENEIEQPPEVIAQLRTILQKTVQLMRSQGDFSSALRLLDGWDASLPLRHARAKLLLEVAVKNSDYDMLREGFQLLQACAEQDYYFSCSLQGMLFSAPHPLLLQMGMIRRNCVLAAQTYLRGLRDAEHQGYDVVYIARNLLTLIFCGRVAIPERIRLRELLEVPEKHVQQGTGAYLTVTPRAAQELLDRVSRYDRTRCAFVQGCRAANAVLQNNGDVKTAEDYLQTDGGLLARILLHGMLNRDAEDNIDYLQPLRRPDGSFFTAEELLSRPLDQYSPIWQYLDAKQLAQALQVPADFAGTEEELPESLQSIINLCAAAPF